MKPSPCRKRPELNRCRLSETANVSYEVADSDVIRDFYATCWGGPSNRAASLGLYVLFLFTQTVRHRDFFL
ncbi:hypothetical protein GR254_02075, partial [Mycobacterium tuberculosis]|nr:hypothetical protein [Mycobacterium tuberculosis]